MIVTESTPSGGAAGVRVDDVIAADVGARGRDREVVRLDDGRDLVADPRVLDADAPARLGHRVAAQADVAARVDDVVRAAPASSSSSAARSTDQPLTSPDGSIVPGTTASASK